MERNEIIAKMMKMANEITGKNSDNWTWDAERAIWRMCFDWNSEHEDEEIFMCECDHDEEGNPTESVCGFYIEDDWFIVEA